MELIFGGLFPSICGQENLTENEVTAIVNDYIIFVLDIISIFPADVKVDIFQTFLFIGDDCDHNVIAIIDQVIRNVSLVSISFLLALYLLTVNPIPFMKLSS